jgi:hypothetical protein
MKRLRFVLQRHPFDPNGGGTSEMSRLMMEAAADAGQVTASVLSSTQWESPWPLECIPKPPLHPARILARSALQRRSLIHTRFRVAALRNQLRSTDDDLYVASHTYMAETILDAFETLDPERLAINTIVSESYVLSSGRGLPPLRRLEARRTESDEVRCLRRAGSIAGFDAEELGRYRQRGLGSTQLLRPAFAPATRTSLGSRNCLLFLGDRTWGPNALALTRLVSLWPALRSRSPDAELLVVGRGPVPKETAQAGIRVLGYLDSLEEVWGEARALVAPITIGGGVRVKILEAASRGVPVVATTEGAGSITTYLPVTPVDDDQEIIDECLSLLHDRGLALRRSAELYEANRAWWTSGRFADDVRKWLRLA